MATKRGAKTRPVGRGDRSRAPSAAGAASAEARAPGRPQRLGYALAVATLVLPAFVVVPVALDSFRLPQRLLAEWLALASLAALAGAARAPRLGAAVRSPAVLAVLPLLLVAAASLATTGHPAHAGDALADFALGAAALGGWSLALPRERLRRLLDATLIPGAGLAAIAILQLHHLWQPMVFGERLGERLAVTSLAGNPGDLAALLVLPCLVAQAGLPGPPGRARTWRLLVLAACLYALAGTQTLTALIAVAAGSLALWAARLPRRRLLALVGAALAIALLLVGLVRPLRERMRDVAAKASSAGELNEALSGRLDGWRVAARLLAEHPLAGVGFGGYRAEFAPAKLRLLHAGVPFYAGHLNAAFAHAHDEYLETGAELGWPGLLALGWGIALALRAAWRTRGDREIRALAWGGLLALALLALAYFPFRLGPVAFGWVAWLAWLLRDPEQSAVRTLAPDEDRRAGRVLPRALLAGVIAVALLAQTVRGWNRLGSSVLVRVVQQQMAVRGANVPGPVMRFAEEALRQAHRRDPASVEPLAFRADLLFLVGRYAEADAAYREAATHEPRGEVLGNWGQLLWRQGRNEEAAIQLRRAVALSSQLGPKPPGTDELVATAPLIPIPPLQPPVAARSNEP